MERLEGKTIGNYHIQYLIKQNDWVATYKVCEANGAARFMKVYDIGSMPSQYRSRGTNVHILNLRKSGLIREDGKFRDNGKVYAYTVRDFHLGRLLSDVLEDGVKFDPDVVHHLIETVAYHFELFYSSLRFPFHNDICPSNIIWEERSRLYEVFVIDDDHAFKNDGSEYPFRTDDLDPEYCSTDALNGIFTEKNDAFSLCVLYYRMITGKHPWDYGIESTDSYETRRSKVLKARMSQPMDEESLLVSDTLRDCAICVLDGLRDVYSRTGLWLKLHEFSDGHKDVPDRLEDSSNEDETQKGFASIAGMDELKKQLSDRVIWPLKNKEQAARYRLTPPNGMLLYGPPGCGKTYFAQKFAEETGFNFRLIKGSDIASEWLHETQMNIGELFKEASREAPMILCFDEFDAFVPQRSTYHGSYYASEVNEFLTQLNNCHKRGIFVIGTTNMKEKIDPAILRKGRMDLQIEILAPDLENRMAIFRLHLKGRPLSEDVDAGELALRTEGYASSDIAFIVNEAAMVAAMADECISQKHLLNAIDTNPSSLDSAKPEDMPRIGF